MQYTIIRVSTGETSVRTDAMDGRSRPLEEFVTGTNAPVGEETCCRARQTESSEG